VNPTYILEKNKVDNIRQKTAQAAQQQKQMEMASQGAAAAKDAADAKRSHAQAGAIK
jgi:hypothetical protein